MKDFVFLHDRQGWRRHCSEWRMTCRARRDTSPLSGTRVRMARAGDESVLVAYVNHTYNPFTIHLQSIYMYMSELDVRATYDLMFETIETLVKNSELHLKLQLQIYFFLKKVSNFV